MGVYAHVATVYKTLAIESLTFPGDLNLSSAERCMGAGAHGGLDPLLNVCDQRPRHHPGNRNGAGVDDLRGGPHWLGVPSARLARRLGCTSGTARRGLIQRDGRLGGQGRRRCINV